MMTGSFPILMLVVYVALFVFMISLAIRFVKAIEKISDAIQQIASKSENN